MPNESLQPNNEMSPEDAKASLGVSTRLVEEMLMAQNPNPEASMRETEEPEQEEVGEERVRAIIQEELGAFKEELMSLLQENEAESLS